MSEMAEMLARSAAIAALNTRAVEHIKAARQAELQGEAVAMAAHQFQARQFARAASLVTAKGPR
jgi:hypothetical protein